MACIRIRRGRYVLDYRDQWGVRRAPSYDLTPEGHAAALADLARIDSGGLPGTDPGITLGAYISEHWLPVIRRRVGALTARSYETNARVHIPAALKGQKLREVTRGQLKRYLADLGTEHGIAESTVAKVCNVVRSIFEAATDEDLIPANPAAGLRPVLGIVDQRTEDVLAMDPARWETFLAVARVRAPERFLELAVLAYAGLRRGELRGLQTEDLDLGARIIRVERQVHDDGRIAGVKGRRGKKRSRMVDMAEPLHELFVPYVADRREYGMATGNRGPWLLYPDWPEQPSASDATTAYHRLRRAMASVLKAARIKDHYTPHCLRHSYARVLLERGEDLLYVSRQLGHASLAMTANIYGRWARIPPKAGGANLLRRREI